MTRDDMNELENLWNDLPTEQPPVDAILREGRGAVRRRHLLMRPIAVAGMTAAVVVAFMAGIAIGPPQAGDGPRADPSPVAFQADLRPAASCQELLDSYQDRAMDVVTAWGWEPESVPMADLSSSGRDTSMLSEQTASETGTNVQEAGIDEPDTVKSDGRLVVRLRGDDLLVYDATGADVDRLSRTQLPRLENGEILLDGDTVVAIGTDRATPRDDRTGERRGSRIVTISLKNPSKPAIESTVTHASRVLSARQHGSTVRLVLAAGLPELDFVLPDGGNVTEAKALAANRRAVRASTIEDWLPSHDTGDGSQPLLDCTDVAVVPDELGLDTVSIVGFEVAAPTKSHAIGLAGATTIAYESADRLFLASSPSGWGCASCLSMDVGPTAGGTSHLFEFELDGIDAVHVASGEVEGTIADRWSLDEAGGVLRVAVGPSAETGNFSSVVTFERDQQELVEIGRIDGLGKNEELKGVRWFDDLAILVTFREIDPLFTIDLAEPAKPKLLGALKVPGFSDYLHPLDDDQLLGIGFTGGRREGAQIALFDVSDTTDVRRSDVVGYRGSAAVATWEPRAFTWLPRHSTVLTVLETGDVGYVAALTVQDGKLRSRLTKVEYGMDSAQVRTIGLPDGRVILVTGEDVRFFDLP